MLADGQTLLHVVAWEGHGRLVALLVREGVSVNVRKRKCSPGDPASRVPSASLCAAQAHGCAAVAPDGMHGPGGCCMRAERWRDLLSAGAWPQCRPVLAARCRGCGRPRPCWIGQRRCTTRRCARSRSRSSRCSITAPTCTRARKVATPRFTRFAAVRWQAPL